MNSASRQGSEGPSLRSVDPTWEGGGAPGPSKNTPSHSEEEAKKTAQNLPPAPTPKIEPPPSPPVRFTPAGDRIESRPPQTASLRPEPSGRKSLRIRRFLGYKLDTAASKQLIWVPNPMRNHLATLLDDFRRYGRETAVVRYHGVRRRVTTYGEIAQLAGRFAQFLVQRGIGPGDRVLIWAENSAEWIAAFHGCLLRGVLAVPLDASGTNDFAARVAADVAPKLAVGDLLLLNQLPPHIPCAPFDNWPAALPLQQAGPIEGLSADTPLEILFTSGTTGDPKGIVLTHGNVLASFEPIEKASKPYLTYERPFHPLRILHTLPLSHVFGQTMGFWVPSIYRAELHFETRLVAPRLVDTIRRERISVLAAVPRVLALLKAHLEATIPGLTERLAEAEEFAANSKGPAASSRGAMAKIAGVARKRWRFRDVHRAFGPKFWALISGGGALPAPLEWFWNAVGLVVVQGYGMTETTALITLNHPFHVAQGTIGKPLAGREVKLAPTAKFWSVGLLSPMPLGPAGRCTRVPMSGWQPVILPRPNPPANSASSAARARSSSLLPASTSTRKI